MFTLFAGSGGIVPAQSRQREANESESPPMERSGMMAGFGATKAIRDSRLRSPAAGSRTNLVFPAGSANFASAARGAPRKLDRPRDYCGVLPVRSIAGYCWAWSGEASRPLVPGGARAVLTVSAVCGRRNAAIALRRCLRIAVAEWSGCKAGESVIVRGRNRADTWQRKCRLGEAGDAVLLRALPSRDSGVANYFREAAIFSFHA